MMRRVLLAGVMILAGVSCQKDDDNTLETSSKTYRISFAKVVRTLTEKEGGIEFSPVWNVGAHVYFADDASTKPGTHVDVTSELISGDGKVLSATFRSISKGTRRIFAICAPEAWVRDKKSIFTFSYDGTYASSAAAIGAADLEASDFLLHPSMGIGEFTIKLSGVSKVVLRTDKDVFPSKMTYDFKSDEAKVSVRKSSISVDVNGPGTYYFPIEPGKEVKGCSFELLNEVGLMLASVSFDGAFCAEIGKVLSFGILGGNSEDILDPDIPQAETAVQAVRNMGVGLNLCATFEELPYDGYNKADRNDPSSFENMYNAVTNNLTMTTTYTAGFRSIRIPVTWFLHMDDPGSTIDKVWLDRIEEVVNMALDAGLYCIINMHHDTGQHSSKGSWLFADWGNYSTLSADFKNIWKQIAERFKDYDYRLLFESYNELLDENKNWFAPASENGYKAANALNQDFVNTVRQTGGRNATRNLIVTTYSASTWEVALKAFVMPMDILPDHLAVQIHSYLPAKFVTAKEDHREEFYESDIVEIDEMFALVKRHIIDRGYPCVLGEYGAYPRKKADGSLNRAHDIHRGRHAAVYARRCLELGIAPMYWYNPMETYHRQWGKWTFEPVKDSLIKAYNEHIITLK